MRKNAARVTQDEHENNHERWLISYADFITLMFAFFVILYATSERDVEKTKKLQESVQKFLIKAGSFGESGAKIEQGEKNFSVIEPPIQTFRQNGVDDTKLLETIQAKIEQKFTEAERKKYFIDLAPEEKGVRIVLAGHQLFSGDTSKFSPSAMEFVNHLGEVLHDEKKPVMIEGHVGKGQQGSYASSWDLASARSVNLLRYFSKKFGMEDSRMAVTTFGASKPLAKTGDVSKNNRLELLVYYKDTEF
jgi:chemotaxis protein MotB